MKLTDLEFAVTHCDDVDQFFALLQRAEVYNESVKKAAEVIGIAHFKKKEPPKEED